MTRFFKKPQLGSSTNCLGSLPCSRVISWSILSGFELKKKKSVVNVEHLPWHKPSGWQSTPRAEGGGSQQDPGQAAPPEPHTGSGPPEKLLLPKSSAATAPEHQNHFTFIKSCPIFQHLFESGSLMSTLLFLRVCKNWASSSRKSQPRTREYKSKY